MVVFGGGSFGTAMATALARQKQSLEVVMLMRDPYVCRDINHTHINARYLQVMAWVLCMRLRVRESRPSSVSGGQGFEWTRAVEAMWACRPIAEHPLGVDAGLEDVRPGLCNRTALQAILRAAQSHAKCGQAHSGIKKVCPA